VVADEGLTPAEVDLVVANPLAPAFLDGLRDRLDGAAVVRVADPRVHTAGLAVAWDTARRQGRLAGARTVLLVSAGAGLTAGAAVLRRPSA
jgi:3-oxoacyl-[acyl-carrier-protein] synthase-3